MYKMKRLMTALTIMGTLFVTQLTAETQKFYGTVTLPTEVTDLLDTCSGAECPSVNVGVHEQFGDGLTTSTGGSVDYNDTSGKYEYLLELIKDEIANDESSNNYQMTIYISNGNMGNEYLYYSFGSDNAVGTTGDINTTDVILHQDETYSSDDGQFLVKDLNLPLAQLSTEINIDLSAKDVGRQKITAQVALPSSVVLGPVLDEFNNQTGYNYVALNVHTPDYSQFVSGDINVIPDSSTGLYMFTTSIANPENVDLRATCKFTQKRLF